MIISIGARAVNTSFDNGIELALQRVMDAGDGTETVGERSVRRWVKRVGTRLPVAARVLAIVSERVFSDTAAMFEHFLTHLYPHHLLQLLQISAEAADSFLGTQGYVWDTQSDMLWALCGAILALLALSKLHDRQITGLTKEG